MNNNFSLILNQIYNSLNSLVKTDNAEELAYLQKMLADINIKLINRVIGNQQQAKLIKPKEKKKNFVLNEVAPNVQIKAFIIDNPTQAHTHKGFWCYHPESKRYYLSVNNKLIYSYITNINSYNKPPIKFTEYDDNRSRTRSDNFYHPPEIFGGDDRRQISEKMCFVPASSTLNSNQKYVYRIGDRDSIAEDLSLASNSDIRLVRDISAHWMMVGYLASVQQAIRDRN